MTTPKVRLQKWSVETKIFIRLKIIVVFAAFLLSLPCVSLSKNPLHFPTQYLKIDSIVSDNQIITTLYD